MASSRPDEPVTALLQWLRQEASIAATPESAQEALERASGHRGEAITITGRDLITALPREVEIPPEVIDPLAG